MGEVSTIARPPRQRWPCAVTLSRPKRDGFDTTPRLSLQTLASQTSSRTETMSFDPTTAYPSSAAFVLKLARGSQPGLGIWVGLIEHMSSGRQGEFHSGAELMAWLAFLSAPNSEPSTPPTAKE